MSSRVPTQQFHMTTRRRAARVTSLPDDVSSSGLAIPALASSSATSPPHRAVTPETATQFQNSSNSSALTEPPVSLSRTLDGLATSPPIPRNEATDGNSDTTLESERTSRALRINHRQESPTRKLGRKRKINRVEPADQPTNTFKKPRQNRRVSLSNGTDTERSDSPNVAATNLPAKKSRRRPASREVTPDDDKQENDVQPRGEADVKKVVSEPLSDDTSKKKQLPEKKNDLGPGFHTRKGREIWPEFHEESPIYYAADAKTRYRPGGPASPAPAPARKTTRGLAGGRGRGGGNGNGAGKGYSKSRGRAGRGDSPNPPNRKRLLTHDDRLSIATIKARQLELKKIFQVVGAQQVELLDQLASRDLNQLVRKAKAHKQVPEYQQVLDDLEAYKQESVQMAMRKREIELEYEEQWFAQEQELIAQKYKARVENVREEHLAGVSGDITIAQRWLAEVDDDDHTEAGLDDDYFPQYHRQPEAGAHVRGYDSMRVTDETAFKHQLSYDDMVRREVIDYDIMKPMMEAMEESYKCYREEQARHQTRNLDSLAAEATKQLGEIKRYLPPKPLDPTEYDAYALSALADVSEWVAQTRPNRQYVYMPLAPGDRFPASALNFAPLGSQPDVTHPLPPPPPPRQTRPGVNQPPQFIFHQPQQMSSSPPGSQFLTSPTSVQPPRIPVTFVNQTIASRKAGKSGKGQRLLLPKA